MYYMIPCTPLPLVSEIYSVTRSTIWSCADRNNLLILVKEGCCYFTIHSVEHFVQAGQAIFIAANTPYVRHPYQNTMCTLCYVHFFTPDSPVILKNEELKIHATKIIETDLLTTFKKGNTDIPTQIYLAETMSFPMDSNDMLSSFHAIAHITMEVGNPYRQLIASLSFINFLLKFSIPVIQQAYQYDLQQTLDIPPVLQRTMIYIQKNYKKKLSTAILAEQANISPQHMIRLFKQHLKTTPINYINQTKVLYAIDLLRQGNMSIKEISYELGFDTPNYFSRVFKQITNKTPQEERNRIKTYH